MAQTQTDEQVIFEIARKMASWESREAYLQEACGDDHHLREQVVALIRAFERNESFLEHPPLELGFDPQRTSDYPISQEPISETPGAVIGSYKLLQQIGEGGFGVVFLAEQERPVKRRVALKVIKPGMDSREVIARFEAERQTLAMMNHPNIAKVFDAGTTGTGRPYFVMELVQGVPITEYCDQCNLTTRERLELFIDVCHAVQHAHQKGVIHRDIKPTNVLVAIQDGKPAPKIIDFGVAKAIGQQLTEHTFATRFAQMVGTPLYMSPEQAELSPLGVDTRSDIYSLGVLLYELLTGTTPFDQDRLRQAGYDEMRRIIREEEPIRPSVRISTLQMDAASTITEHRRTDVRRLKQAVRGDLDWIVMKCLEKDRGRRYASANAVAEELQNYLADLPVRATSPSVSYRLRKYCKRHRIFLTAFGALAATLLFGIVGTSWQATVARNERDRAVEAEMVAAAHERAARLAAKREKQTHDQTRRLLYVSDIGQAHRALERNSLSAALALLERYLPEDEEEDLRGFDWFYLWRQCHREEYEIPAAGWQLAISPNGETIAAGSQDGTIRLIDLASLRTGMTLAVDSGQSKQVAYSSDGSSLASVSSNQVVRLWDMPSGRVRGDIGEQSADITAAAFSPDGTEIATVSTSRAIGIWDVQSLQLKRTMAGINRDAHCIAYSPNGELLAIGGGEYADSGRVKIINAQTGKRAATLANPENLQSPYFILTLAFSPNGKTIAAAGRDRLVYLWDVKTGELVRVFGRRDSSWVYAPEFPGHTDWITSVAFDPNGKTLASLSLDRSIKLWNVLSGQLITTVVAFDGRAQSIVFSPDGSQLLAADESGRIKAWNIRNLLFEDKLPLRYGDIQSLSLSASGEQVAINGPGCGLQIIDINSGASLANVKDKSPPHSSARLSPNGELLVSASEDGAIECWSLANNEQFNLRPAFLTPSPDFAFSPDGLFLASAGNGGAVRLYDMENRKLIRNLKGHTGPVKKVVFSVDGQHLATGSLDETVKIWDTVTGRLLMTLSGHEGGAIALAFSLDGRKIATGTRSPKPLIRIWDLATGTLDGTLRGHRASVQSLAFLDERTLASVSLDSTLRVWNLPTLSETIVFEDHTHYLWDLAVTADRRTIYSAGAGGEIRFWKAASHHEVAKKPSKTLVQNKN